MLIDRPVGSNRAAAPGGRRPLASRIERNFRTGASSNL
jgi:hypothetical protein